MTPTFRRFVAGVLTVAAALLAGPSLAEEPQTGLPVAPLTVMSGAARHAFEVEVAADDRQRAYGLMFREEMPEDRGMLFVFANDSQRHFWMKNTPLPLDILFISGAGEIVSIAADTVPFSTDTIPSGEPARYVLELNAGTAAKLGIDAGDMVESPVLSGE